MFYREYFTINPVLSGGTKFWELTHVKIGRSRRETVLEYFEDEIKARELCAKCNRRLDIEKKKPLEVDEATIIVFAVIVCLVLSCFLVLGTGVK
jgi:hypothetical protein